MINTLIGLKDYALTIERNLNDVNMVKQINNSININPYLNNSCSDNNINNFMDYGINDNLDYQVDYNCNEINQNQNSREFLNNMKKMMNQIDMRLNDEMAQNLDC